MSFLGVIRIHERSCFKLIGIVVIDDQKSIILNMEETGSKSELMVHKYVQDTQGSGRNRG